MTRRINAWIAAEDEARRHYSGLFSIPPAHLWIERAAMIALGKDDPIGLLDRDWTALELIAALRFIDFQAWADYETVDLEDSVIPEGVARRFDEETVKYQGEIWRIHKYDPDPFPSLPHAHNQYDGLKMDLSNGKLYQKRNLVGQLSRKNLLAFRSRVKRIPLPDLVV